MLLEQYKRNLSFNPIIEGMITFDSSDRTEISEAINQLNACIEDSEVGISLNFILIIIVNFNQDYAMRSIHLIAISGHGRVDRHIRFRKTSPIIISSR